MAATATAQSSTCLDPLPAKKAGKGRKALKQKSSGTSEANILAGKLAEPSPISPPLPLDSGPQKENHDSLRQSKSNKKKKSKAKSKEQETDNSFEKDLQEMQEMLKKLKIEKEKAEELLKEKDEILKLKEEELETRGREQMKLQMELKKLQKIKEFKPTMTLSTTQSVNAVLEKKDKKKKGCPERKKPSASYALWCKDQWNEVKKANPDADFKEISSMLAAKWKTISQEEKQPYEEKYRADKEAYLQIVSKEKREIEAMKLLEEEQKQKTAMDLLEQYLLFKQEAEKENNSKKTKKEKDPLKPKQPVSAFFLFTNEKRADLLKEGKNLLEVSKLMGEEWKTMTEEQKKPYEVRAKEKKDKYLQEMELYTQKREEEAANFKKEEEERMKIQKHEALQLLKKKEKTENIIKQTKEKKKKKKEERNCDPNKPKRPLSSFFLFSMEARKNLLQERPGINNSTLNTIISVKWKVELSEEEKQIWSEKAAEGMKAYKKELEEYKKTVAAAAAEQEKKT